MEQDTNQNLDKLDIIKITNLKVEAIIGVFEWERAITQPLLISVALYTDISKAGASDDIKHAINYKSVCDDITKWCVDAKAKLIERLAVDIATKLLANYDIATVEVSVGKPTAIPEANLVSVSIVRSK